LKNEIRRETQTHPRPRAGFKRRTAFAMMKPYLTAITLGVAASAIGSVILAYGSAITAGVIRHGLEAWPWLFSVSVIPCAMLPPIMLWLGSKVSFRGWRYFRIFLLAFTAVALAGSVGAVVVESTSHGMASVNISGYLAWCWAYAIVLLPVSYPLATLVLFLSERKRKP